MEGAYRNKILFLDDVFLLEVHNLRRRVNPAVKHPEPIFQLDAPWDRDDDFHDLRTTVGTIASPMVNRGMAGWLIGSMILSPRLRTVRPTLVATIDLDFNNYGYYTTMHLITPSAGDNYFLILGTSLRLIAFAI